MLDAIIRSSPKDQKADLCDKTRERLCPIPRFLCVLLPFQLDSSLRLCRSDLSWRCCCLLTHTTWWIEFAIFSTSLTTLLLSGIEELKLEYPQPDEQTVASIPSTRRGKASQSTASQLPQIPSTDNFIAIGLKMA